jgi:putative transcriptional regulator
VKKQIQLIAARLQKGLDQKEVAKLIDMSQQTISHWENGRIVPDIRQMIILEKIYGVPKEQLFPNIFDEQAATNEQKIA